MPEPERHDSALPPRVDAVVLDFDGVLTDNRVLVFDDGHEAVMCNRGDGLGLGLLKAAGIPLLILSKERNPVVGRRAAKLGIECLQAIDDKATALQRWADEKGIELSNALFVGNDVNDTGCMALVGCAACPADAHPDARAAAHLVLHKKGGEGCVRELCDLLLQHLEPPQSSEESPEP